jgi:iron-sulfur cluster insertion protein
MTVTVTKDALEQIEEILLSEGSKYVRAFVEGGGCAGFNYGFMLDDNKNDDDFELTERLLVDSMSMQYLTGATIDYKVELMGANFVVNNPNAKSTCGCGSSFSV